MNFEIYMMKFTDHWKVLTILQHHITHFRKRKKAQNYQDKQLKIQAMREPNPKCNK